MSFLSIIVGFRNREPERVKLLLDSLSGQTEKNFEVVFVDFGSESGLAAIVQHTVAGFKFAEYHYVNSRGQLWNRSRSLNEGLRRAKGDMIFTSDVDFIFHPDFTRICKLPETQSQPTYFKVGYLNQKTSQRIAEFTNLNAESLSDEDAIGPLLISKAEINRVGGYDEFFEIWGLEDNDLKQRLEFQGKRLNFYQQQILIWHLWHPPVRTGNQLPAGWLPFLSDYFKAKKDTQDKLFISRLNPDRPALKMIQDGELKSLQITCKKHFLHVLLLQELEKLNSGEGLKICFNFHDEQNVQGRPLNKLLSNFNQFSASQGWPLHVKNKNMEGYLGKQEAWETLVYFIKIHFKLIQDYYLPADLSLENAILVKR